ncbi:hypothetical protein AVEN_198402-1 [Araneus ventricosus]|uniref:Uncharacterized protein n=1 Tax=Araneus ventricosus TaxID=182803 RepID=A0A4Y2TKW4_ARAVE|nr:hypothetical protein AVEN_22257-1 [Araneus ventricosus]GBO00375.1 hypothetical protein AVEN_92028-1 [Araneus ventricosus]GBO00390.1 hypothetical protein AVEN_262553-1 [Araneus ventricosus]GBO00394.1 hypothetical protein AVEN_198402-1 [Araneus ventricosus]
MYDFFRLLPSILRPDAISSRRTLSCLYKLPFILLQAGRLWVADLTSRRNHKDVFRSSQYDSVDLYGYFLEAFGVSKFLSPALIGK